MTPARLRKIEEIFHAALDQKPDEIDAFLDAACEGDEFLRRKVEALLASHQRAGSFIEMPATGIATRVIENERADLLVDQTIGHYKISERIGTGGMGEVYLAIDLTAGRKAALKVLPMRFTGDAERLKRFQQEAHAVVALNHPNILTVYEIGEADSIHYIVSELIEGETLRRRLARGRLQVGEAVDIAIQVTGALAAAHGAGIVHRDIKPENIMLRPDGYVKVLDFGIAKLAEQELPVTVAADEAMRLLETNLGSILGTVRYMSPEQGRGAPIDKRTDIWSLGAVLYEMAAGHAPFTGDTPREVMTAILTREPPPLSSYMTQTPSELQQIVSRALHKNPGERYQNANEMLEALKGLRHKLEFAAELERYAALRFWVRWIRSPTALVLTVLAVALALVFPLYWLRNPTKSPMLKNSIAVLPFENLSEKKENAYFADGVQDEILTDLSKIAELKVISRTSVMQYKSGVARNLRQVAQELGVANILEGSVQRTGNRVRVSAQLLDARNDVHLWAEHYERPLDDVFAIQTEIAKAIADQLRAKLSPGEKSAIERPPTADLAAFDLYSHAKTLLLRSLYSGAQSKENLLQAVDLLNQAVARDPNFLLAYCRLAFAHDVLYLTDIDHTPARVASADAAVQTALRLQPDAGEAHLALARHLYSGYLDYDHAKQELAIAQRMLPNSSELFELKGFIDRRQGRWDESTRNLEKVLELDPLNFFTLSQITTNYYCLRRYEQGAAVLDRTLAVAPKDVVTRITRAQADLHWRADPKPLHTTIDAILAEDPTAAPTVANIWLNLALCEHDPIAANRALVALSGDSYRLFHIILSPAFVEGLIARIRGDAAGARAAFTTARAQQEELVRKQPDYAPALGTLGLIDAGLGRKEDALREGRRAVELLPVERDAFGGTDMIQFFSVICAWTGEKELALQQLDIVTRMPSAVTYGRLKLHPFWDPLRGDPRFEKIVTSLAPKDASKK